MKPLLRNFSYYCNIGFPLGYGKLHSHPHDEISLIAQGNITYVSDGLLAKRSGRSLIYSKAYQLHNPYVDPACTYERYHFAFHAKDLYDILPQLAEKKVSSGIVSLSDALFCELLHFAKLLESSYQPMPATDEEIQQQKLLLASFYMHTIGLMATERAALSTPPDNYIRDVILYIEDHFAEKCVIEHLASRFFVSRTKLINDFRSSTGMSIAGFFTLTRLQHAKALLEQGASVANTAERCGYGDSSYFIHVFTLHNHMTPLKYQQMMKKKEF